MAFNRYTQITPAKYDARSLQDTLYLPTLKRKQHDQLDTKAAMAKSQLDRFDNLGYADDMVTKEKDRLNAKMDEFTSELTSQGVNTGSKSKFLDIGSDFSKSTSESGMLYKSDQIRKKWLKGKEKSLDTAIAAGNDPEQSLKNINNVYEEMAANGDPEKLEFIDVPQSPEYYDVATFLNEFRADVGFTEYDELINKRNIQMGKDGKFTPVGDDRLTKSNELQLQQLNILAEKMLLNPGSKGMATANWNGKSEEQLREEVNSAIKMKKEISVTSQRRKPYTQTSKGTKNSEDDRESVSNTNRQVSLNLENTQDLTDTLSTLRSQKKEALETGTLEDIERTSVRVREFENIEYASNKLGEKVFNNIAGEPAEAFFKKLNNFYDGLVTRKPGDKEFDTGGEERITKTVELVGGYLDSETRSTDVNQENPRNSYDLELNEDGNDYTLRRNGFSSKVPINNNRKNFQTEVAISTKVTLPKNVGESLKALKPIFTEGTKAKEAAQDKFVSQYTKTRTKVTPLYNNLSDKSNLEIQALGLIDSSANHPSEAVIRDSSGKAIADSETNEDLNSAASMENLFNYATKNPNNFKINSMSLSSMGDEHGYLINLTPNDEVLVDENWDNISIPEGGTIEFFLKVDKKSLGGSDGIGTFFRKGFNSVDRHDFKRRMEYGTITPTSNPSNLGKDYELSSLSFTGEINQDQTIDFLKNGNDISVEKVSIENPGKSQGSLTWTELFEGIKDNILPNNTLSRSVSQLYDMAFRRLDNDQLNAFENLVKEGKDTKNFLKEALEDKKVILKANSSDLEILLDATQQ